MKKKIFSWACDFSSFRGEGILARSFACDLSTIKKIDIYVKSPENSYFVKDGKINKITNNLNKKINFGLFQNYLWPVYGILYLWIKYIKKEKILYLNFMPLWNFLLFYFLPPKTIIGPITGFIPKKKIDNFSNIIRIILIPLFYKLSLIIIFKRFKSLIFSTDLLKKKFLKKDHFKLHFNYLISSNLNKIKFSSKKRKIDLLVYNRNYTVKEHYKLNNLIKFLLQKNYRVHCIGDNLKIKGLKNYNIINRDKVKKLLKNTKLVISSPENPYSLFTLDALNMGAKVLFDKKYKNRLFFIKYNSKHYINLDKQNYNKIEKEIKNKTNQMILNTYEINSIKRGVLNHFNNILIY